MDKKIVNDWNRIKKKSNLVCKSCTESEFDIKSMPNILLCRHPRHTLYSRHYNNLTNQFDYTKTDNLIISYSFFCNCNSYDRRTSLVSTHWLPDNFCQNGVANLNLLVEYLSSHCDHIQAIFFCYYTKNYNEFLKMNIDLTNVSEYILNPPERLKNIIESINDTNIQFLEINTESRENVKEIKIKVDWNHYLIKKDLDKNYLCNCIGFTIHKTLCKHIKYIKYLEWKKIKIAKDLEEKIDVGIMLAFKFIQKDN